jgi:hypothetical protein
MLAALAPDRGACQDYVVEKYKPSPMLVRHRTLEKREDFIVMKQLRARWPLTLPAHETENYHQPGDPGLFAACPGRSSRMVGSGNQRKISNCTRIRPHRSNRFIRRDEEGHFKQ